MSEINWHFFFGKFQCTPKERSSKSFVNLQENYPALDKQELTSFEKYKSNLKKLLPSSHRFLILIACLAILTSCARHKPMYTGTASKPTEVSALPAEDPLYSVFLTGSSGGVTDLTEAPALALMERVLAKADEKSTVVFLGDQVGETGFPTKDENKESHESAKRQIKAQLEVVKDFKGKVAMTHGDLDWKSGVGAAERIEDYIEKKYGEEIVYPQNACGDPVILEVTPDLGILIINSQWFISDWYDHEEINEGCVTQSRKGFRWKLTNMVKGLAFKHVIVAMHHPVISRGPRGGKKGLANWATAKIGLEQQLNSPKMEDLKGILEGLFNGHPAVTFVSGHEYLLQYGDFDGHPVVGSGTAVATTAGKTGQGTSFTAGKAGFAEIHYYANGEAWVRYREADGSPFGKTLFETKLYTKPIEKYDGDFKLYESGQDSIQFAPFAGYRKFGPIYKWAFGNNNRELFETPYTYPILRLDEFAGGVEVTKRGGGGQTNSLRLTDSQGRDYALRSIKKDPTRLLPANARVKPLITLTQDVFFTANPFGALTAADLAEAVEIPHAYPRLVYLPAHPQLGALNATFADGLFLLEERPNSNWIAEDGPFGNPKKIDGRDDVLARAQESYKDQVDQKALVRARLLDVLLGDFDRHSDQWRFAEYKDEETGISQWQVIPRDRDQAMIKIDGAILKLGGMTLPAVREVQNFDDKQPWIEDFTFQARLLDRRFLNELTREEWLAAARELQEKLTDAEIESSFEKWPTAAQRGRKEKYTAALKTRRDNLVRYAEKLYAFQAKEVYVVGTDRDDFFDVQRHEDGSLTVDIYDYKGQEKGPRYYHRTFLPKETGSVQLFGLREEDKFEVRGTSINAGVKIRIIPGPEKDKVITSDKTRALQKRTRVYAWPDQDKLELGKETEKHLSKSYRLNQYNYRDVNYDFGLWLPKFGFNVDDGLQLGLTYQKHYYTFHRHFTQRFGGYYTSATQGAQLNYNFGIVDLAPRLNFNVDALYQTSNFAVNFFGIGNETTEISGERSFYRIPQEIIRLAPILTYRHKVHDGGLTFGLVGESIVLDRDPDKSLGALEPDNILFDRAWYIEANLGYQYENIDDKGFPRDGMSFSAEAGLRRRTEPEPTTMPTFETDLTVYQSLWNGAVIASRVGFGTTAGDYYFYDGQGLGEGMLRGYRRDRFIGEHMFYNNIDVRQEFKKTDTKTPFGVFASFDHGRVWVDEGEIQESDTWHSSFGGGLFVRPLKIFTMSAGYYVPEDDSDPVVRVVAGFDF